METEFQRQRRRRRGVPIGWIDQLYEEISADRMLVEIEEERVMIDRNFNGVNDAFLSTNCLECR